MTFTYLQQCFAVFSAVDIDESNLKMHQTTGTENWKYFVKMNINIWIYRIYKLKSKYTFAKSFYILYIGKEANFNLHAWNA